MYTSCCKVAHETAEKTKTAARAPQTKEINFFIFYPLPLLVLVLKYLFGRKFIVKGYGNGKFGPTDPITRQQLAAIFFRYANYKNFKIVSDDFDADDKDLIAAYAIEALNWGVENDVIWVTNDLVRPTENALRWEVAAAIYAFCEYVAK